MADLLKTLIVQIKLKDNNFHEIRDRGIANELYERYQLQCVLETFSDYIKDGKPLKGWEHYLQVINVMIKSAPLEWISAFVNGFDDPLTQSLCISCLKTVSRIAEPTTFETREYYIYEKEDFEGFAHKNYLVLTIFQTLFNRIVNLEGVEKTFGRKCLVQTCMLSLSIISRHMEENLWTNPEVKDLAASLLHLQKQEFGCKTNCNLLVVNTKSEESCEDLAISPKTSIFGMLLQQWIPLLQRNCWQKNPVVSASFTWCLAQLKSPNASAFLEFVLPPALLFTDDSELKNKLMGIRCLIAIIEEAGSEELRWYGRADVIFEALKLQLYRTEEILLACVQKALLLILNVLVKKTDSIASTTKYDEIFQLIIQSASHENKLVLRRVHTENIHHFIDCLGISSVKYIRLLLELTEEYLEIADPPNEEARINILKALIALLKNAWPRIPAHSSNILRILVKTIHQTTSSDLMVTENVKEELVSYLIESLKLLISIDKNVTHKLKSILPYAKGCTDILFPLTNE